MFVIQDDDDEFWETLPLDEFQDIAKPADPLPTNGEPKCHNVPVKISTSSSGWTSNQLQSCLPGPIPKIDSTVLKEKALLEKNPHNDPKRKESGLKRKFPGPAGILPKSFPSDTDQNSRDDTCLISGERETDVFKTLSPSEPNPSDDVFSSHQWLALVSDIGANASNILSKFSIKNMLMKASRRILPRGKIPLVMAVVDSLEIHGCDSSIVLRDPSANIQGALHKDITKDPVTALCVGCVIVLRQTSVISPSPRTHYLNITPANMVLVYSQAANSSVQKSMFGTSNCSSNQTAYPTVAQMLEDSEMELKRLDTSVKTTFSADSSFNVPTTPISHTSIFPHRFNNSVKHYPDQQLHHFLTTATDHTRTTRCALTNKLNNKNNSSSISHTTLHLSPFLSRRLPHPLSHTLRPSNPNPHPPSNTGRRIVNESSVPFPPLHGTHPQDHHHGNRKSHTNPDDFPDDDSDFLAICDSIDFMETNITPSKYENIPKGIVKEMQPSISNPPACVNVVQSNTRDKDDDDDEIICKGHNSVLVSKSSTETLLGDVENIRDKCDNDVNFKAVAASSRRDARIQLGLPKITTPTFGFDTNAAIWDDDLSDDLLSQL